MSMTDPIADMLTRVRNASAAHHDEWRCHTRRSKRGSPRSCSPRAISPVCARRSTRWQDLIVDLKYGPNRERSISGVRRVSKPGSARVRQVDAMPRVLGGLGVAIISTSSGY